MVQDEKEVEKLMGYFDPFMVGVQQTNPITTEPLIKRIAKRIKGIFKPYKKKVTLSFTATGKMVNFAKVERNVYGLVKVGFKKLVFNINGRKSYDLILALIGSDDDE